MARDPGRPAWPIVLTGEPWRSPATAGRCIGSRDAGSGKEILKLTMGEEDRIKLRPARLDRLQSRRNARGLRVGGRESADLGRDPG